MQCSIWQLIVSLSTAFFYFKLHCFPSKFFRKNSNKKYITRQFKSKRSEPSQLNYLIYLIIFRSSQRKLIIYLILIAKIPRVNNSASLLLFKGVSKVK